MATTANNIENGNNVANNVANNQDGYNAEVTNEVIVLNGDTFYKKNIVVGQRYRYGSHYFVIDKFEMRGTHLYYCGTLDNKPFKNDLHALKVACECTERRSINRSANDTENGKAVKVKRTAKESAQIIEAKYTKAIEAIKAILAKLPKEYIMHDLTIEYFDYLRQDCKELVTAILDAEKAKQAERLNRIDELFKTLPDVQGKAVVAMGNGDFEIAAELAKQAKELKAELDALQAEEAAYVASREDATRIVSTAPTAETAETENEETK